MATELDLDDVAAQSKKAAAELAELRESERSWIDTATVFYRMGEFYRRLVDECAKHLGEEVFVADDGSVSEDPLRLKVPELVAKQAAELAELRTELESLRKVQMSAAWACLCDGSVCSVHLTKEAAMLIAENRREQNRGRDFLFEVVPLYR